MGLRLSRTKNTSLKMKEDSGLNTRRRSKIEYVPTKKIECYYETEMINKKEKFKLRFIRDVEFFIGEAFDFIDSQNSFSEITLILDIDLTLGEAILLPNPPSDGNSKVNMNGKDVDVSLLKRLHELEKIEWFHGGYCCFFIRPYFHHFINFCINNFKEVIIWTNGVEKHAEDMCKLIMKITGKKLRYFWREHSTGTELIKVVSRIGLDPTKTWMVDDDKRHFCNAPALKQSSIFRQEMYNNMSWKPMSSQPMYSKDAYLINPDITFFHAPEFSVSYENFFNKVIHNWHDEQNMVDIYDDWFLFLIWNWKFIKENKLDVKRFDKYENKFVYNS